MHGHRELIPLGPYMFGRKPLLGFVHNSKPAATKTWPHSDTFLKTMFSKMVLDSVGKPGIG